MSTVTAIFTSGGDAHRITPPEHEPAVTTFDEVDEAINYAGEVLHAIESLESLAVANAPESANYLVNHAVENYISKFDVPEVALEAQDDAKTSRIKKVILYLYAVVQRVFNVLFDFFKSHKANARKIIPLTKNYIGRSDSLTSSIASQLVIKDRSLMNSLHIDGLPPKKIPELYESLLETFEKQYEQSAVNEVVALIQAAKTKDAARVKKEAEALKAKLETGFKASLEVVSDSELRIFNEKRSEGNVYWLSPVMFGQNYIAGVIGTDIHANGTFNYRCSIKRDPEVQLRVASFPVLTPEEIRSVSRTSLKIAENVIRYARDEDLLQKALREAAFVTTQETDESSVAALKDMAILGQSSYIVYLRYTVRTMESLMRWCNLSLKKYEGVTGD